MTGWQGVDYWVVAVAIVISLATFSFASNPRFKQASFIALVVLGLWGSTFEWKMVLGLCVVTNLVWRVVRARRMTRLRNRMSTFEKHPDVRQTKIAVGSKIALFLMTPMAAYMQLVAVIAIASDFAFHMLGLLPITFGEMRPSSLASWNGSIVDASIRIYFVVWSVGWVVRLLKLRLVDTKQTFVFLRKFRSEYVGLTTRQVTPVLGAFGHVVTLYDKTFSAHKPRDPLGVFEPLSGDMLRLQPGDDWESVVKSAIDWADAVAIELTEVSEAIRWELRETARRKPPSRILLITFFRITDDVRREVAAAGLTEATLVSFSSRQQFRQEVWQFARRNRMLEATT